MTPAMVNRAAILAATVEGFAEGPALELLRENMRIFIAVVAGATMAITSYVAAQGVGPQVELVHQPCDTKTSARVFVSAKGVVSLNGAVTPIEALLPALQKLHIQDVCYSRENPQEIEPHPVALKALNALMQLKLPIAFYWDAAFQERVHFKQ
jgi:hypothetical protein